MSGPPPGRSGRSEGDVSGSDGHPKNRMRDASAGRQSEPRQGEADGGDPRKDPTPARCPKTMEVAKTVFGVSVRRACRAAPAPRAIPSRSDRRGTCAESAANGSRAWAPSPVARRRPCAAAPSCRRHARWRWPSLQPVPAGRQSALTKGEGFREGFRQPGKFCLGKQRPQGHDRAHSSVGHHLSLGRMMQGSQHG